MLILKYDCYFKFDKLDLIKDLKYEGKARREFHKKFSSDSFRNSKRQK